MNENEKEYGAVGNIRIKEPKKKKKKRKSDETSLGIKILVWFMFFAMLLGFLGPLAMYLINIISAS